MLPHTLRMRQDIEKRRDLTIQIGAHQSIARHSRSYVRIAVEGEIAKLSHCFQVPQGSQPVVVKLQPPAYARV